MDDDKPRPKKKHELGEDLSLLSVGELRERFGTDHSLERLFFELTGSAPSHL